MLEGYTGINPYIRKLRNEYLKNKKIQLTDNQSKYILDNHDKDPLPINRVINITKYLGEELQKQDNLGFIPERILVEFLLADTEKSFHVYGKLKQNQLESSMYWLPKTQVLDDIYFEPINIEVDFSKYNDILSKTNKKLYLHQEEGIKFLLSRNGCILGDSMGLGKTTQSIIAALESGAKKILVVCPSSAKINWEREINVFCDETAIVNGKNWEESKFTIINYDILKNFHTIESNVKENNTNRELVNAKFDLVIVDEAHYLKNNDSIRGKIMAELSIKYNIPKFWLLSGTPVANRPMDFFNLLKIIKSPIANNWKHFATRYCDGKQFFRTLKNGRRKQIWLTDGASNLEELSMKTKNCILRRLKENVLDMPDKIITPMYHKLNDSEVKQYEALWDEYIEKRKLEGKKTNNLQKELVELVMLRKFIAMQSIPYTIEMAENAIEMGCKVIIFTNFTEELEALHNHFGKISVKHNGPMSTSKKQHAVDQFQNNPKIKVFVGNIVSAGIAITLTEASVVIFNSFAWVSGLNEQAEDRCVFKDQLVMTANGYKKIQNIKLNDFVYTHNGNFKKVINTHTHLERKKIKVNINALGFNKDLILTHDHKLYVYNSLTSNFEWVEAGSLNIYNHKLTFKCNNQPVQRKKELEVKNYVNENFNNNFGVKQHNGMLKRLPDKVELTNDLLYAFGFFIAEGWVNDISINKSSNVSICQKITNKKMYDASTYIIEIIKNAFKINKHSEYIDKQNVKTCTIHSKNLAKNFIEWFGKGVKNKKLPIWVDELDNEQLINLLNGYYHGDGYKRKSRQQAITVSPFLGSQLVRYNTNLGRNVSLKLVDTKLNDEFYYNIEYSEVQENKSNKIVKIDNYITYPIISIGFSKPKRGEERVYDLSVEDDHSFVVGNYNVHNCYRIGQKNNVNIYYQLFLDTISLRMWETLNYKKDVISTILGEKIYSEEEIEKIMEKLLNNEL